MDTPSVDRQGSGSSRECANDNSSKNSDVTEQTQPVGRPFISVTSVRRATDEQNINQRIKHSDERKQWTAIKALMKKINSLSDALGNAGWGPPYEIPTKPTRKGPTMGLFFGHAKKLENCSLIMQTPDSMERYSFYGKLMQHTSCAPYAITNVTYGHVVGIGRCALCATQCGKVVIYKIDNFERALVVDTLQYYSEDGNAQESSGESDTEEQSVRAPNAFEINFLKLVKTFDEYARTLIIGNQLGHIIIVDLPSMKPINVIYYLGEGQREDGRTQATDTNRMTTVSSDDEYDEPAQQQMFKTPIKRSEHVTYISCLKVQPVINDVWVGYGDGTFAVFEIPSGNCKKHVPADIMKKDTHSNIEIDARWQRVTSIHFSSMLEIALVVYGNIRIDVWDTRSYALLKSVPVAVLTCDSGLISSMQLYDGYEKTCLLFIGSMDGSLIMRKIERHTNNEISWSLVLNLLYDVKYSPIASDKRQDGNNVDYADFRGAPITCIYPLLSHNAVVVGNACGAIVAAWNIRRCIKES
ncbi:uncharacterized protein BXIN_2843 [Babesia sp. Xinjiang]|uniref:uncharacterized protein n=1 Tax=Babesia sp. Xinjiang TaxID=462227 RepID=UPI000A21C066|nr:uncharacterized protein BXIN_2843 [Babesia sp. Xinjiang]ORM39385.1 hypothetical protein BXIN_2843 [Babesia sp. Xinjiang]